MNVDLLVDGCIETVETTCMFYIQYTVSTRFNFQIPEVRTQLTCHCEYPFKPPYTCLFDHMRDGVAL